MIPNLTTEQRRENLEKAKAARQRRAAILKGVADGSDTQPVDSEGSLIALDDLVSYRGTLLQVVAMSHKQKVVLRTPGKKKGGFWVASHNCTLVKRHARKEN